MSPQLTRSRIGRRVFLLTSAIAVIPLTLVGAGLFLKIDSNFQARTRDHLAESARTYTQQVLERLLIASGLLRGLDSPEPGSDLFRHVAIVQSDGKIQADEFDLPDTLLDRLQDADREILYFDTDNGGSRAILAIPAGSRTVIAELSDTYLWGDQASYPYAVHYCAFEFPRTVPVHCSAPINPDTIDMIAARSSSNGSVNWSDGPTSMTSSYRDLFIPSKFDGPSLTFVASQPQNVGIAPWKSFRTIYVPTLLLTIVLAVLASRMQARALLRPIDAIRQATIRYRDGDFSARADVRTRDELGELALSVNSMAAEVQNRIQMLNRLSQIDQLILSGADIEQIAATTLQHMVAVANLRCAAIAIADAAIPEEATLHSLASGEGNVRVMRLGPVMHELGDMGPTELLVDVDSIPDTSIQEVLSGHAAASARVIEIRISDRLDALLFAGYASEQTPDSSSLKRTRQLVDQMTIALEIRERERKLITQATVDILTGLPNRHLFMDRLRQAILQARNEQHSLSIAFIDLDRFKDVNDSRGHDTGDRLLKLVADRLTRAVPETDTVARLGGDEFVIIHPHTHGAETIEQIGERVLEQLLEPFHVDSIEIVVNASIGLATYPRDGEDVSSLLRKADLAMYGAKGSGRGRIHEFTPSMEESLNRKVSMEKDLRDALERNQFRLSYQPQVLIQSRRYVAAEALLRWEHPERGLIPPDAFIPVAEATGYIRILGAWVMTNACRQFRAWREQNVPIERVAVNVSVAQFSEQGFPDQVEQCIRQAGIQPNHLELEVTENVFIADIERAKRTIEKLKALGVSIAIDDFGTGYSSLNYLKQLPFDVLKIDRAFVMDLPDNKKSRAIVHAIAAMGQTLNRTVLAEGIESDRQLTYLAQLGVRMGQGYFFSRPLDADALEKLFLANHQATLRTQTG